MKRIRIAISEEEYCALLMLRQAKTGVLTAATLAHDLLRIGRGCEKRARKCLALGEQALLANERTVSFAHAVQVALEARRDRRARTLSDFRYLAKRLLTRCPGLAERRVRAITPAECAAYLQQAFDTPRQRFKGHAILSAIFRTAQRHGWCAANPMQSVDKPRLREQEIHILSAEQIGRLLQAAGEYRGGMCLPAVGMMLYAGLRPQEVARLEWEDVDLEHGCISIRPRHSKTGGARRVTIHPPLRRLLEGWAEKRQAGGRICPGNWARHWRAVRQAAGLDAWQPDVLRHTYASHHLAHFRSYSELQVEMGHRSAELLRTRYVSMPISGDLFATVAPDGGCDQFHTS